LRVPVFDHDLFSRVFGIADFVAKSEESWHHTKLLAKQRHWGETSPRNSDLIPEKGVVPTPYAASVKGDLKAGPEDITPGFKTRARGYFSDGTNQKHAGRGQ